MSTIFGIWNRNGKPVSNELEIMFRGIKHFPHERYDFIVKDNFAIGHLLTFNTPEAAHENMPKHLKKYNLIFAAEGRIDNRDELFSKLSIPLNQQLSFPDGDLILEAYLKWGKECVDYLIGKWSLTAFHTDSEELFVARDKWDYTSINYYLDDSVFAFAPSNKALLALPFVDEKIDEIMIIRLLIFWQGDFDKTYHKKIKRLLPSYYMHFRDYSYDLKKYWNYRDIKVQKEVNVEQCVEELLEMMNLAVEARLRSYKPVAATLSGGMDSSTVCAIAAMQLKKQSKDLYTFSHVPCFTPSKNLEKFWFGDERPYIESFVNMYENIKHRYLTSEHLSPIQGIKKAIELYGEPIYGASNAFWMVDIYTSVAKENFGAILLGEFGNANISWTGVVEHFPLLHLLRRYGIKKSINLKFTRPVFFQDTGLGMLYRKLKLSRSPWRSYSYLNEELELKFNIVRRMQESNFDPTFSEYFKIPQDDALLIYDVSIPRLSLGAHMGNETGLEFRDPTADERVIKYALSIPNEFYATPLKRQIVRNMMKGKLPDDILMNTKKGRQGADLSERVFAYSKEFDKEIEAIKASEFVRFVNIKKIEAEWEKAKKNPADYPIDQMAYLLRTIGAFQIN